MSTRGSNAMRRNTAAPKPKSNSTAPPRRRTKPAAKKTGRKTGVKKINKAGRLLRLLFYCGIAFVIAIRYVNVYDLHSELVAKEQEAQSLIAANKQTELNIESMIDRGRIEQYAEEELEMVKPGQHQIIYVEAADTDLVRSGTPRGENQSLIDRAIEVITSFFESF